MDSEAQHEQAFDPDCDFCRIVAGGMPAEVIWRDSENVAFFPIRPAVPGHTLVVPTRHVLDYWALDESSASRLARAVLLVGRGIRAAVQPDGMNLISSAGEAAWQTVFHLHIHIVPRWLGDPIKRMWPDESPTIGEDRVHDLANHIRDAVRAQPWTTE